MVYHLYQRTIAIKGKKTKVWYYWYYDENNKQVRKSCGQHGKPCTVKREAQAFIETLPKNPNDKSSTITFNQFCKNMYEPGSTFLTKQHNRGIDYKASTIYQRQHYIIPFLEKFGDFEVNKVTGLDIDNWLLELPYSTSVRNHIQMMIEEIEYELYSYHLVDTPMALKRYKRNDTKEKGILTFPEIQRLFPEDQNEIVKIWKLKFNRETDEEAYMFATMIYTIITTGMRSCEIRALQMDQFIRADAILVNAMIDSAEKRVNQLKKGSKEHKKWRVVILPTKTQKMINNYRAMNNFTTNYVFERRGERLTSAFLLDHLKAVLAKNNIDHKSRNIGVHSLRFTYNSLMRPEISGDNLRLMMGHVKEQMTDYYDKSEALSHLPELLKNKDIIDSVWN